MHPSQDFNVVLNSFFSLLQLCELTLVFIKFCFTIPFGEHSKALRCFQHWQDSTKNKHQTERVKVNTNNERVHTFGSALNYRRIYRYKSFRIIFRRRIPTSSVAGIYIYMQTSQLFSTVSPDLVWNLFIPLHLPLCLKQELQFCMALETSWEKGKIWKIVYSKEFSYILKTTFQSGICLR